MSAIDEAGGWTEAQRRRWAVEMVLQHLQPSCADGVVQEAETLARYLLSGPSGGGAVTAGIHIRQDAFGGSPIMGEADTAAPSGRPT